MRPPTSSIDVFARESALLRATQAGRRRSAISTAAAARVYVNDAAVRVEAIGEDRARRDGGRRYAAHAARGAAPVVQGHAGEHRRAAPQLADATVEQRRYIF